VIGAVGLLALIGLRARREQAALRAQVAGLRERLDQLGMRLEVTEQDLTVALSQTGVAQGLLLEKGIADADEVEDMRRRLVSDAEAPGHGEAIH
jgi:Tfp pilus assembly protein PilO